MGPRKVDCDLLVQNGTVITMDGAKNIFSPGAVAISGTRIVAVGPQSVVESQFHGRKVIDARGGMVHPGFIDAHNHIVHTSARGVFSDIHVAGQRPVNFADWKATVTPEDEALSSASAALEMLRCGFTTFIEPGSLFDTDAAAEAVSSVGARALFSPLYLWDRNETFEAIPALAGKALMARAPVDFRRCERSLDRELHRNDQSDALIRGYIFVYGEGTASGELMQCAHALAREHGVPLHTHVGYVPGTDRMYKQMTGYTQIEHFAEIGVLDSHTVLVHANAISDSDESLVRDSGCQIVWCPAAFFSLGIWSQVPFMMQQRQRRGTSIALGTDGALDGTPGDVRRAARFQSQGYGEPIAPGQLLEMQTVNGARAAGLGPVLGSLEPDRLADVVIQSPSGTGNDPDNNPVHLLSLGVGANCADTVIVNGEVVLEAAQSPRVDEEVLRERLRQSVARRARDVGITIQPEWN